MIFLSHSWSEKSVARRIVESFAKQGLPVWLDEQQLSAGAPLRSNLLNSIAGSQVYLYLVSEKANNSEWVREELQHALSCERDLDLVVVPVRLAGDDTPLPKPLTGRVHHDLSTQAGGPAKLAHDLSALPNVKVVSPGARIAATVRLVARRVEHTLLETEGLLGDGTTRQTLILDQAFERLDLRYWRLAETRIPGSTQDSPETLARADRSIDDVHAECRRAINGAGALIAEHAHRRTSVRHRYYYTCAIERALHIFLHRLEWNCRYLESWNGATAFGQEAMEERHLPAPFTGHTCEFVVSGQSIGKVDVPPHGHPWLKGTKLTPLPLSKPFLDMTEGQVGTAIGDLVARRTLAGTLRTPDLPEPDALLYGLG